MALIDTGTEVSLTHCAYESLIELLPYGTRFVQSYSFVEKKKVDYNILSNFSYLRKNKNATIPENQLKMFRSVFRATPTITRAATFNKARFVPSASQFVCVPTRFYSSSLSRDEITSRIADVIKAFDKSSASANISAETQFSKDLGLDSLDTVELLVSIEEEFDIEFPDKVADEIKTVGEAIDYIASNPESN